jgi:hypothetical protein
MKKSILLFLAFLITAGAAMYQRKTGPTYPREVKVVLNDSLYTIDLVRSIGLDERPEVKLKITDTTISARLFVKRYKSQDDYQMREFVFREYPVNSYIMNKLFHITNEKGYFAPVPEQAPAGKIQYYIEITDKNGSQSVMKDTPVVIRFKGSVPGYILGPHIILMFLAMLFSTTSGLFAIFKVPAYKTYSKWTLGFLLAGGLVLGPLVQKYAFGEFWTGIPFGWDLTDNKLLIALTFWVYAVVVNRTKEKSFPTILAAIVLLLVYSIPHSLFGSELDYESGKVIQGLIAFFFFRFQKNLKLSAA